MYETKDHVTSVDAAPDTIEGLEASWSQPWWLPIMYAFSRIRRQVAIAGIAGIVVMVWFAGVKAHHTQILALAIGSIASIVIATEWIDRRYYENTRKREAASGDAAQDEGAAR